MIKRARIAALVFAAASLFAGGAALAYVPQTASVTAVKAAAAPPLAAAFDDAAWKPALKLSGFFDITDRRNAEHPTTMWMLYDDKNLYVGFYAAQSGVPIVSKQNVDHAGVQSDDHVTIWIDPSGNGSRTYNFRVNPSGIHDEFSSENSRYAPDWTSVAKVESNGDYRALMVVPLSAIRAQNAPVQRWKINAIRFIAALNETDTWAYEPTMSDPTSSQYWPWLDGIRLARKATRPQPHADLYGLESAGFDRAQFQNGIGTFEQENPRLLGGDVTVPLTNTLAFVGTLNPDFSNIEQDQTTIAPQEFARQYAEYRPFFAQGAGYINSIPTSNINSFQSLFYTPSIGIFNRGVKLEGTQGPNSIGLLNVTGPGLDDSAFGYGFAKSDNSLQVGVEDVDANHTSDLTGTENVHDNAGGLGLATTNPHSGVFSLANYQTESGTLVDDSSAAERYQFATGVQNARELAIVMYNDVGPEFSPLDGYVQENDVRGPQAFYQYNGVEPADARVKSYSLDVGGDRYLDRSGAVRESDLFGGAGITLQNTLAIGYNDSTSLLRGYADSFPVYSGGETLPYNAQSLSLGYRDGSPSPTDFNYSFGPFQGYYLTQSSTTATRHYGVYALSVEYDSSVEHGMERYGTSGLNSQWLRRISLSRNFGKNTSLAIGLRGVNGTGGFALPGTNFSAAFHEHFRNLDELYVNFGTPASATTLDRLLVKYVFHFGGATGT